MHTHYYRSSTSQSAQGASYELPPVQSVTSSSPFQQGSRLLSAPPSRPSSGMTMAHILQPLPQQPPSTVPTTTYSRSYESSGSPAEGGPSTLPDAPQINGSGTSSTAFLRHGGGAGGQHQQSPQPLQQKRAYRQRRKDPSCDACRERKVKCDASESSSCTECTNRKVRCQFTKETNRRMSSIKQVQDLEKQLMSAKQQLQQLRSGMLRSDNLMDLDLDGAGQPQLKLPDIAYRPSRRPKAPISQDFNDVRTNLRNYGRGIWKAPTPFRQLGPKSILTTDPPPLPAKEVIDHLLTQYYTHIHSTLPVIHWPSFLKEYEQVYRAGSVLGAPREWVAVLFGVFACGTLHTLDSDREEKGKEFIRISCGVIDIWQDSFTLDQARAALLVSIFLYEVNSKSASWVWNGSAIRVAQEIGLHLESGPWPALEGEMRKRVWWGMYTWDRLLALEMGKPVLISDHDCDIGLPCPVDDQFISEGGCVPETQQTTSLLATIHVVRSIGQLTRTLRCTTISPQTLETFDRHFTACLATFPDQYHPRSNQHLDPRSLAPILYLQNARLILHRHNISPYCPVEIRSSALDFSVSICQDTARLLSRCMQPDSTLDDEDWRSIFAASGGGILCTHLWRCIILLLFRQEYTTALVCIKASAIIGNSRAANVACGRYIAFFVKCLLDRLRHNTLVNLERDEEMLAYASGDMQGTSDGSWVWEGSETSSQLEGLSSRLGSPACFAPSGTKDDGSTEDSADRWEGWEWVERNVQYLLNEKEQQQQREAQHTRQLTDTSYSSTETGAGSSDTVAIRSNSSHSRMTIASII